MNNITYPKSFGTKDNGERSCHWVNIESRLPDEEGEYLITIQFKNGKIFTIPAYFNKDDNVWEDPAAEFDAFKSNILAWMKYPKPYQNA